jgi:hypothetical protein
LIGKIQIKYHSGDVSIDDTIILKMFLKNTGCTETLKSITQNLIPEAIPSQKYPMNMGLNLNIYGDMGI